MQAFYTKNRRQLLTGVAILAVVIPILLSILLTLPHSQSNFLIYQESANDSRLEEKIADQPKLPFPVSTTRMTDEKSTVSQTVLVDINHDGQQELLVIGEMYNGSNIRIGSLWLLIWSHIENRWIEAQHTMLNAHQNSSYFLSAAVFTNSSSCKIIVTGISLSTPILTVYTFTSNFTLNGIFTLSEYGFQSIRSAKILSNTSDSVNLAAIGGKSSKGLLQTLRYFANNNSMVPISAIEWISGTIVASDCLYGNDQYYCFISGRVLNATLNSYMMIISIATDNLLTLTLREILPLTYSSYNFYLTSQFVEWKTLDVSFTIMACGFIYDSGIYYQAICSLLEYNFTANLLHEELKFTFGPTSYDVLKSVTGVMIDMEGDHSKELALFVTDESATTPNTTLYIFDKSLTPLQALYTASIIDSSSIGQILVYSACQTITNVTGDNVPALIAGGKQIGSGSQYYAIINTYSFPQFYYSMKINRNTFVIGQELSIAVNISNWHDKAPSGIGFSLAANYDQQTLIFAYFNYTILSNPTQFVVELSPPNVRINSTFHQFCLTINNSDYQIRRNFNLTVVNGMVPSIKATLQRDYYVISDLYGHLELYIENKLPIEVDIYNYQLKNIIFPVNRAGDGNLGGRYYADSSSSILFRFTFYLNYKHFDDQPQTIELFLITNIGIFKGTFQITVSYQNPQLLLLDSRGYLGLATLIFAMEIALVIVITQMKSRNVLNQKAKSLGYRNAAEMRIATVVKARNPQELQVIKLGQFSSLQQLQQESDLVKAFLTKITPNSAISLQSIAEKTQLPLIHVKSIIESIMTSNPIGEYNPDTQVFTRISEEEQDLEKAFSQWLDGEQGKRGKDAKI